MDINLYNYNWKDEYDNYINGIKTLQDEVFGSRRSGGENKDMYDFFDGVFDALMKSSNFGFNEAFPASNVFTDSTGCTIELALAGYKKEQLHIDVDGNKFTVSADASTDKTDEDKKYHSHRVKSSSFKRVYSVPAEIYDISKLSASYVDGMLSIFIPKKEESAPKTKSITIE